MDTAPDLCTRILTFPIDEGTPDLTFEHRLARENAWSADFARRVVLEYRRFVYLAMTAGHQVTPSDQVDQAWHLHLTYTRSYWERMCGELLGRPLHHGPTRGGTAEATRFDHQYEQTLAAYRKMFGEEPPADIWPPSAVRFGDDLHFVRVNAARNWVVPKGAAKRAAVLAAVALAVAVFATGCDVRVNPITLKGLDFLWFFVPLVLAVLVFAVVTQRLLRGPGAGSFDDRPELDWADAAYLTAGKHRLTAAAIARLAAVGSVRVSSDGKTLESCGLPTSGLTAVEDAVYYSLPLARDDRASLKVMADRVETAFAARERELREEGYTVPFWRRALAALISVPPVAFVFGFGFLRWTVAQQQSLPREALGSLLSFTLAACAILLALAFRRLSRRGRYALKRLRRAADRTDPAAAGMSVGLYGTTALATCGAEPLIALAAWYPRPTASAAGGCGTGCGGGGDGGGCGGGGCGGGGCGGCGGCGG